MGRLGGRVEGTEAEMRESVVERFVARVVRRWGSIRIASGVDVIAGERGRGGSGGMRERGEGIGGIGQWMDWY
jgi:hypothetical protein